MKQLKEYIGEALVTHRITRPIRKHTPKTVRPESKEELHEIIYSTFKKEGYGSDLNFIDTSLITDMSFLFYKYIGVNCDISEWDVSNVKDMHCMFQASNFNGDISGWDVSSVEDMSYMFSQSNFNGDISEWDVSNVKNMTGMFSRSMFNSDISGWDVSNVKTMYCMFRYNSEFNGDISGWDVSNVEDITDIFSNCPLDKVYTGEIDKNGHFEKR